MPAVNVAEAKAGRGRPGLTFDVQIRLVSCSVGVLALRRVFHVQMAATASDGGLSCAACIISGCEMNKGPRWSTITAETMVLGFQLPLFR